MRRVVPAVVASVAVALSLASCGGSASSGPDPARQGQGRGSIPNYYGVAAIPPRPAPHLALRDSLGRLVNMDQFRGKAVLVVFIYAHCPDICPLMVGNLHTAQAELGPEARRFQIVAVSVDPRGDTPSTVRSFLREHRMTGRMEYLLGSRPRLQRVWRAWNILAGPSQPGSPDRIEHSELVYGINASGRIATYYSHDFLPDQIVHDVPILASE